MSLQGLCQGHHGGRRCPRAGGAESGGRVNTGGRYVPPISLAAGTYNSTITLIDPRAANSPQTVSVTLDVTLPGVTIVQSLGSTDVTEGGATDSYTVVLDNQPTGDVEIDRSVADGQSTVDGLATTSITLTAANWSTGVTVAVAAVDDALAEGTHASTITHAINTAATTASEYNSVSIADVDVTVTDNDLAGFSVTPVSGLTTTEAGSTDTFTVALSSQPTADVTIDVYSDDTTEGTASPATLTFTTSNWTTAQTVTVTGVDDPSADGDIVYTIVLNPASSGDGSYNSFDPPNVDVVNMDDDVPDVLISESAGSTQVTEGGAPDTYTVVLATLPVADVTITVTPDAQSIVSAASLTFTSLNWNTAQTVTVTAVDDFVAEGAHWSTITHSLEISTDPNYTTGAITIDDVVADLTDDDIAGVLIAESGASTDVSESGPTSDTYTVALTSEPTADVTIAISVVEAPAQSTISGTSLTFTSANWSTAQTVTVTAVDDLVIEASPHWSTITHSLGSSVDPNFDSATATFTINDVVANVTDDDVAGPSEPQGLYGAEGGCGCAPAGAAPMSTLQRSLGALLAYALLLMLCLWRGFRNGRRLPKMLT